MTSIALPRFRLTNRNHVQEHSKEDTSHSTRSARSTTSDDLQLQIIEETETACLKEMKDHFRNFGVRLPKEKAFRYACFHDFDAEEAIQHIRDDKRNPYLKLKMQDLEDNFASNELFPIPYLQTRNNTEVVYMRPSPFFNGSKKSCDQFVASLCYVLNDLSQTKKQCRNGVTVIANLKNMQKEEFNKEQCKRLIKALQGDLVPTSVETFIIVSPPSWFGKIWKYLRSKMSREFARKVHIINEDRLAEFLQSDYQMYLPEDLCQGFAHAHEISEDYVDIKMVQERKETQ